MCLMDSYLDIDQVKSNLFDVVEDINFFHPVKASYCVLD